MTGSDIVTVSNIFNYTKVTDRYVPWVGFPHTSNPSLYPVSDIQQDWTLICASSSKSTSIHAILTRKLDTLDNQDRPITNKDLHVIYAWGFDESLEIDHHGPSNHGSDLINFFKKDKLLDKTTYKVRHNINHNDKIAIKQSPSFPSVDSDGSIDLLIKTYVTSENTTQYICQKYDVASKFTDAIHITAIDPIFSNLHHFRVFACGNNPRSKSLSRSYFDRPVIALDNNCNTHLCSAELYNWGPGTDHFVLPDLVGFQVDNS